MNIEEIKNTILCGDSLSVLKTMPSESVDCVVTSPPYYKLRNYGTEGQIGQENTLNEYLNRLLEITNELKRVLKPTGTLFWNHGDSYNGTGGNRKIETERETYKKYNSKLKAGPGTKENMPKKCLLGQPYRLAIRMVDEQKWHWRNTIIWHKPNAMPDSTTDRFTNDYEPILFFTKNTDYYFEQLLEKSMWFEKDKRAITGPSKGGKAISGNYAINKGGAFRKDGMKNKRTVWSINTETFNGEHFAAYPSKLIINLIKAGCPERGVCLDPFMGSGTTAVVAKKMNRNFIGIELNPEYIKIAEARLKTIQKGLF